MTYHGRVKDGVIVLEGAPSLAEGAAVRVEVEQPTAGRPPRGSAEALLQADVRWAGDVGELDRLLDEVQQMREEDLRLQQESDRPQARDQSL